jgi:hypothetical protein
MKILLFYCLLLLPLGGSGTDLQLSELQQQPVSYELTRGKALLFNSFAALPAASHNTISITLQSVTPPSAIWVVVFGLGMLLVAYFLKKMLVKIGRQLV